MSIQGRFWSTLSSVGKGMLAAEHSHEFVDLYRRLGVALAHYLGRSIGGLLLASLPLAAFAYALSASALAPWLREASWQIVFFGMATVGVVAAMIHRRWT
jgi:hypothetical protein